MAPILWTYSSEVLDCVGADCDPVCMDWIDGVDIGGGLMTRRWKRYVALIFLAAFLLVPNPAQRALFWYGQERAERIVNIVVDTTLPESTVPARPQVPAGPDR